MLAVARAGEHLQVRIHALYQARGANVRVRVVGGQHEDLGAVGVRRAQQVGAGRVAVVDLGAEAAGNIHLVGAVLQRGEGDLLRAHHAPDDLPDPAEAGDDHARMVVVDVVGLAFFLFRGVFAQPARHHQQDQRRRCHRQADDHEQLVAQLRIHQSGLQRFGKHHEAELTAHRQHGAQLHGLAPVQAAGEATHRQQHQDLERQQAQHAAGDHRRLVGNHVQVDAHADGDEEKAQEQALEGFDMRFKFVPELRLGQQHAGQEGAQAHRQPGLVHDPGVAHHHQQRAGGEHFHRPRLGHHPQQVAQQEPPADHDRQDRADRDHHAVERRRRTFQRLGRAQQRDRRQQRDGDEVLEEQDRERHAPVFGGQLLAFGQQLQAHRGGRQGQAHADNQRRLPAIHAQRRDGGDGRGRNKHLQATGAEHLAPHHPQARRAQLQADHEQQHHHAQLGRGQHVVGVGHQRQPVRADRHAGRQVTQDRAQAQPTEQRHRDHRGDEEDQQQGEETAGIVHVAIMPRPLGR